jgi:hypothetical protein
MEIEDSSIDIPIGQSNVKLDVIKGAEEATASEKKMGLFAALKLYPTAAFWAVFLTTSLVMNGYDTSVCESEQFLCCSMRILNLIFAVISC